MKRALFIGIAGPSGSGKSSVCKALVDSDKSLELVGEDAGCFVSGSVNTSYDERDSDTELPSNVRWDRVQSQIDLARERGGAVVFDHFLLPFLPRIGERLDLLVVLDAAETVGGGELQRRACFFRERRVQRRTRSEQESQDLSRYYDTAVWPTYSTITRPALKNLIRFMHDRSDGVFIFIDPLEHNLNVVITKVKRFIANNRNVLLNKHGPVSVDIQPSVHS